MSIEGWFPCELYDHCEKGSAIVAIIWKPLCGETDFSSISMIVAICGNLLSEVRSTFFCSDRSHGKQPLTAA